MKGLRLAEPGEQLNILCLGAHSDDIEIGVGGTILSLIEADLELQVHWCVGSATGLRADEAEASAAAFLEGASDYHVEFGNFTDGYFPAQSQSIKHWLGDLRSRITPDLVFTHSRDDAHQDHREICELTWNLFRNHLILEYEIPKWDGDLTRPNTYVPLAKETLQRKISLLLAHFGSQRNKDWFDPETFRALARLRGMECRAPERYAEAFHLKKASLALM